MKFQFVILIVLSFFFIYILLFPKQAAFRKIFLLGIVGLMGLFAVKPDWSTDIAQYFGIGRGADLLFYISHLTMFFVTLIYYLKFKGIEMRLTKLVAEIALQNVVDSSER